MLRRAGPYRDPGLEDHDEGLEDYLLLLLSDSNLPTGGFVASSGLESYNAHGLLSRPPNSEILFSDSRTGQGSTSSSIPLIHPPSQASIASSTLSFASSTMESYARSALPFLSAVHSMVQGFCQDYASLTVDADDEKELGELEKRHGLIDQKLEDLMEAISKCDSSYHTMTLNHVVRRASKAQGIALLTLYSKAFSKPLELSKFGYRPWLGGKDVQRDEVTEKTMAAKMKERRRRISSILVERLKRDIRRTSAMLQPLTKTQQGHLPICFGVFTSCLGLSLEKSVKLHLFLQARSLLSSSIRLNTLGPYLAHQLILFELRELISGVLAKVSDTFYLVSEARDERMARHRHHLGGIPALEDIEMVDGKTVDKEETGAYRLDDGRQQGEEGKGEAEENRSETSGLKSEGKEGGNGDQPPVKGGKGNGSNDVDPAGWTWDWEEDEVQDFLPSYERRDRSQGPTSRFDSKTRSFWSSPCAPATTFPLGEIIQARHDQLHSRLFNS
ncbi:hypothetical protein IE53DRAFT_366936 [Violaceomyces palustris]|uniref:Uncharacterized protein n=1 Tax=Violaceomyces palustris TaxID=1673888 RepID=A0ACD0P3X8_9BASI|nr:hypothetical protein IE53DRAFT_366936 [Violaceomyces palustris]